MNIKESGGVTVSGASLFMRISAYLDSSQWKYSADESVSTFEMDVGVASGSVRVVIRCADLRGLERMQVYVRYPVYVPADRRSAVAEGITRANYGMTCSSLEMDLSDGEVGVKSGITSDSLIGNLSIDHALEAALGTAERFFAPILALAYSNIEPCRMLAMATAAKDSISGGLE